MIDKIFHKSCACSIIKVGRKIAHLDAPSRMTIAVSSRNFLDHYPEQLLSGLSAWAAKERVIYSFIVLEGKSPAELLKEFKRSKDREYLKEKDQKNRKGFAKDNQPFETLYVGSSKNLDSRLRQHFGYKNKTTYSMQLKHWLNTDSIERLEINVWKYCLVDQKIVQAIEDHLWDTLMPMLGKRGGK